MRSESAALREANSKDLGILLQQQLQLVNKVAAIENSVSELDRAGAPPPTMLGQRRISSSVAATADEARELQLSLLEKRATALSTEVSSQKSRTASVDSEALRRSEENTWLRSQLSTMTTRAERAEEALKHVPKGREAPRSRSPRQLLAGEGGRGLERGVDTELRQRLESDVKALRRANRDLQQQLAAERAVSSAGVEVRDDNKASADAAQMRASALGEQLQAMKDAMQAAHSRHDEALSRLQAQRNNEREEVGSLCGLGVTSVGMGVSGRLQ